ncbi:MAG: nucleotidyltransferase domain-containing protein [Acidobacteria bacterium]|nr:nucleotidyltransferase domain-containing protein [Acidobacteriota bacterium]
MLSDLRRGLSDLYGDRLVQLILFGSRARGDARPDSDYDILLVFRDQPDLAVETERTCCVATQQNL